MIHIVIPAAGRGLRFKDSQYQKPKPIISWHNKSMLDHVVDNFLDENHKITIIKQEELDFTKKNSNVNIININYFTDGPASTASLADIIPDEPLVITNCDQIIKDWHPEDFYSFANKYDAVLGCFFSYRQHNSYVKINEDLLVENVKEKEQISNIATNGFHYWSSGRLFLESYEHMVRSKDVVNNEYYVAPTYNYLIKNGYKIGVYMFNRHYAIGTPEQLEEFISYESR